MQLICFDLDGTLINSIDGIYNSLKYACTKNNFKLTPKDNLIAQIGPPLKTYLNKVISDEINYKQFDKVISDFRFHHNKKGFRNYKLYPGALELLKYIKNQNSLNQIFIVTNKPYLLSRKSITFLKINEFIDELYSIDGSSDNKFIWSKYYSNSKHNILKFIENKVSNSFGYYYIGDTLDDLLATKYTKFKFIYASYGYGKKITENIKTLKIRKLLQLNELLF